MGNLQVRNITDLMDRRIIIKREMHLMEEGKNRITNEMNPIEEGAGPREVAVDPTTIEKNPTGEEAAVDTTEEEAGPREEEEAVPRGEEAAPPTETEKIHFNISTEAVKQQQQQLLITW